MIPQNNREDLKKKAEIERLMTAAHVYRSRGDYESAAQNIRQVLSLDPNNMDAREFGADILFARGQIQKAADEYKRIMEEDNSRATAEQKYARAIVMLAEGKRQQMLLREMVENPSKFRTPPRNPWIATILSLAPGFGHIYLGEFVKGAVLFSAAILSWLLFYATAPTVYPMASASERITMFLQNMGVATVFFACLGVFIQIYALVDAPATANRIQKRYTEGEPE